MRKHSPPTASPDPGAARLKFMLLEAAFIIGTALLAWIIGKWFFRFGP